MPSAQKNPRNTLHFQKEDPSSEDRQLTSVEKKKVMKKKENESSAEKKSKKEAIESSTDKVDKKKTTISKNLEPASPALSSSKRRSSSNSHTKTDEVKENNNSNNNNNVENSIEPMDVSKDSPHTPSSSKKKKHKKDKKKKEHESDDTATPKKEQMDTDATPKKKKKKTDSKEREKQSFDDNNNDAMETSPFADSNDTLPKLTQSPTAVSSDEINNNTSPQLLKPTPATTTTTTTTTSADDDDDDALDQDNKDPLLPDVPMTPTAAPTKLPPTMDVMVHRVRYLQFRPSAILCMAVTPYHPNSTTNPSTATTTTQQQQQQQQQWLAVSHQNGSVEVRGVDEKFRVLGTVAGLRQKAVDSMAWICGRSTTATSTTATTTKCQPTLIGASNDGTLFAIHFARGQLTNVMPSGGGAIFCLQSLCSVQNCQGNAGGCRRLVAAGCEDGSVRIFQLAENDHNDNEEAQDRGVVPNPPRLHLVSTIPSAGAAILSLAWRTFHGNNNAGAGSTVLFAGVADGTIRRYDANNDNALIGGGAAAGSREENAGWRSTFRMTVECYGRSTPTRVWKLLLLSDGTVVSGDSLGHVQFWDGMTGTLMQSFEQNDCKADVLDVAVSSDENKVFASGVDSRVVCIERANFTTHQRQKWILSHAQRPHTHDVKALVMCRRNDGFGTSTDVADVDDVLCTGGVDTKVCTYLVKKFQKFRPRSYYPWPSQSHISVASTTRVLLMRRETKVDLYQLSTTPPADEFSPTDLMIIPEGNTLVGSMEIKSAGNFVCSDISDNGQLVAISDHATLLLFQIQYTKNNDGTTLWVDPHKVTLPESLRVPCLALKFASNNLLMAATVNGPLHIINISEAGEDNVVQARLAQTLHVIPSSSFSIHEICVSSDHQWIATVSNDGGAGTVQVFRRSEGTSTPTYQPWWSLPALHSPSSAVRFMDSTTTMDTTTTTTLAVACCNFALYMFNVQNKTLSEWSEANGFPMSETLPPELKHRNDVPIRLAYNPSSPQKLLMGSFGAFAAVNLEKKLPDHCRIFPERHVRGSSRKRRRTKSNDMEQDEMMSTVTTDDSKNCTICLRYNSMLHMDFLDDNEMLVVEQPWLDVVSTFPAALDRKVYGI